MKSAPDYFAMLPFAYYFDHIDPFDKYGSGESTLTEPYRNIVNNGVQAYQLLSYLDCVENCFGDLVKSAVSRLQQNILNEMGKMGREVRQAQAIVDRALETKPVFITNQGRRFYLPIEMNVALILLLDSPASPDYVPEPSKRSQRIKHIGNDADWILSRYLIRGRTDIARAFAPMFDEIQRHCGGSRKPQ